MSVAVNIMFAAHLDVDSNVNDLLRALTDILKWQLIPVDVFVILQMYCDICGHVLWLCFQYTL